MRLLLYFLMLAAPPVLADEAATGPALGSVSQIFSYPGDGFAVMPLADNADFVAARNAYLAGNADKLGLYAQRLKNSPLEVYVSYYQLRLDLAKADAQPDLSPIKGAVTAFLARPADTPAIDLLRAEWLKMLGRKQQWELFDAEFPLLINKNVELSCYALQSRTRNNYLMTLRDARPLWFDGNTLPENCGILFEAARFAGILTEDDLRRRLRLALELNNVTLAVFLIEQLKEDSAKLSIELRKAAADPERYLRNLSLAGASEGRRIIALFALQRLARQNTGLATLRWAKIAAHFPETDQLYFYGWLGYEAARNLNDRALEWYSAAKNTPLNERQLAWKVRAALRAQDWPTVLESVDAMPENQQREAAWRYWKARALKALGNPAEAMALFAPLSGEYHFYGQLALTEMVDVPVMSEQQANFKPSESAIAEISARPGIQRTIALYRAGLRSEALEEWRWALRDFSDRELLAVAEVARRNEMYDRAIGAADKTVNLHDFSLRYLAPYRDAMQAHVRENDLDEAWVFGLMRQESRFITGAKSGVGASGLMQIMPSTARWVASRLGLKNYRDELLHQLDTNIRLGTYYMKTVLSQSYNSPVLATASYNAGPLRALQWRGSHLLEGAVYTESIPFEETREYVKKVMSNTVYYADQFGTAPRTLKQRLGIITPKTAVNPQSIPYGP